MKRVLNLLLVLLFCFSLISCSSNDKQEETNIKENTSVDVDTDSKSNVGVVNPMVTYDSIEKMNGAVGVNIVIPSSVPATINHISTVKDEIAQVDFTLDGHKWTLRGSKIIDQDISGIYNENNQFTSGEDIVIYLNEYYIDRFFTEGKQYTIVLSNADNYDQEKYCNYLFDMEKALKQASDLNGIAGNYMDSTSQRASMEIMKYEGTYEITVRWSSSDSEETVWTMSGAAFEKNKLTYRGEEIATYGYNENGEEYVIDTTASNNIGYFEIKDNKLYWTGAAMDNCKECIFEKVN